MYFTMTRFSGFWNSRFCNSNWKWFLVLQPPVPQNAKMLNSEMDASSRTTTLLQGHVTFRDLRVFKPKCLDSLSSEFPKCWITKCWNAEPRSKGESMAPDIFGISWTKSSQCSDSKISCHANPWIPKIWVRSGSDGYWSFALDMTTQI